MDFAFQFLHYSGMRVNLPILGLPVEIPQVAILEHAAGWSWKRDATDHHNLWLALEGEGTFEHAGTRHSFSAGSMILFPASLPTIGRSTGGLRLTNFSAHLHATGRAAEGLDRWAHAGQPVRLRNFIWASHLCRYLSETFYHGPAESRDVVGSGLDLLLRSLAFERTRPGEDPTGLAIVQIIERIRRNPAAAYSVAEMAKLAGLSESQFSRRFRAMSRLTPNRFLVEERLGRAEYYLRETDFSIQRIASRLGYRDVYFFSRQFRRFRGIAPSRLR